LDTLDFRAINWIVGILLRVNLVYLQHKSASGMRNRVAVTSVKLRSLHWTACASHAYGVYTYWTLLQMPNRTC